MSVRHARAEREEYGLRIQKGPRQRRDVVARGAAVPTLAPAARSVASDASLGSFSPDRY
jgi:hypothetical protein